LTWKRSDLKCMSTSMAGICSFGIDTLDDKLCETKMMVEEVSELVVLGCKVDRKGSTWAAVDYRMKKAETAFNADSKIFCSRSASIKIRFEEWNKRVVPVLLHGCGGWAWSDELQLYLHRWESRQLARMIGFKKQTVDMENWWSARIKAARAKYSQLGFKTICQRVAEQIFDFSQRVASSRHECTCEGKMRLALTWRCNEWWEQRKAWIDREKHKTRLAPGRPQVRWEDVFNKFAGVRWFEKAIQDSVEWKGRKKEFVHFVAARAGQNQSERKMKFEVIEEMKKQKLDEEADEIEAWWPWQHLNGRARRLEFVGDSMLVVNWFNGVWPIRKDAYRSLMERNMNLIYEVSCHHNLQPRCRHAPWARHVKRRWNKRADELATLGKGMGLDTCSVQVWTFELAEVKFLRGFWDGGFDDEFPEEVGLGWHLQFCGERPDSGTSWKPLFEASAKTKGFSSACAEIAAFTNLVAMTCKLLQSMEFGDWQTIPIVPPEM